MNEFLFVVQRDHQTLFTPEQLQKYLKNWQEWLISLGANDILASQLKRWDKAGRVLKEDRNITVGPYAECKKSIDSLITVYAADYEEAKEIARGCPVLELGGIVEIRMAV